MGEEFWRRRGAVVNRCAGRWTHLVLCCCRVGIGSKRYSRKGRFVGLGPVETVGGRLAGYSVVYWISIISSLLAL